MIKMDCSQSKTSKLAGDVIFVLNLPKLSYAWDMWSSEVRAVIDKM